MIQIFICMTKCQAGFATAFNIIIDVNPELIINVRPSKIAGGCGKP